MQRRCYVCNIIFRYFFEGNLEQMELGFFRVKGVRCAIDRHIPLSNLMKSGKNVVIFTHLRPRLNQQETCKANVPATTDIAPL